MWACPQFAAVAWNAMLLEQSMGIHCNVDKLLAYVTACVAVVVSLGPDNFLAIAMGSSQWRHAAALCALGVGLEIICPTLTATSG